MVLEKYSHREQDIWRWHLAGVNDIGAIVDLAHYQFENEIDQIFTPDQNLFARNIGVAAVTQAFDRSQTQLLIAKHRDTNEIFAYSWLNRNIYMPYASEECAEAAFLHMDMRLSVRTRICLMSQIIQQWILWCQIWQIPILVSSTIRGDQRAFLSLHQQAGFSVRGSIAYMRIEQHNQEKKT